MSRILKRYNVNLIIIDYRFDGDEHLEQKNTRHSISVSWQRCIAPHFSQRWHSPISHAITVKPHTVLHSIFSTE